MLEVFRLLPEALEKQLRGHAQGAGVLGSQKVAVTTCLEGKGILQNVL